MLGKLKNLKAIDLFCILKEKGVETLKECVTSLTYVNRYPFSAIARPIVGLNRTSIWGCRLTDDQRRGSFFVFQNINHTVIYSIIFIFKVLYQRLQKQMMMISL
jgi:hypothetical protein